jgi:uncharacterized membrane protein YkvA (DUF1232 family)
VSDVKLAQFQEAAVRHIVARVQDREGSRRMLLADEVGLGKTVVAQGVIQALLKGRRRPLTVIYLCSNAEIAEQNRTKLDPDSRKPLGRVTELAVSRTDLDAELLLYSFTPGTSLKQGTGLAWERRLLLYLLQRIYDVPVGTKPWREFFRCGAGEESWYRDTTLTALGEFERKTSIAFQQELAAAWRVAKLDQEQAIPAIRGMVAGFEVDNREDRIRRNQLISRLRGVMQRVALRHIRPDLVILDEVQRFRDILDEASNPDHIAAELFSRRVPVLILSATPYRALTLGHEVAEGASSHHDDFIKTLDFLFDTDKDTPARIQRNLAQFGERLKMPGPADQLDHQLLELKRALEADLTKVICRTERNRYVLDRKKGVDDGAIASGAMPGKGELEEFFLLHRALAASARMGQITEFWKSAPSLLTFLDANYHVVRTLRDGKVKVPRALLTAPSQVRTLAERNHRISKVVDIALGEDGAPPRLWVAPTFSYYRDDYFGVSKPRKVLVFSGWRFVPKAVAIVTSRVAADRLGGEPEDASQPIRFTEKWSFHVFDLCFPSPALAKVGQQAFMAARQDERARAEDVLEAAERILRRELRQVHVEVVPSGGHRTWQVAMRLEQHQGRSRDIVDALSECIDEQEDGAAEHLLRHVESVEEWLRPSRLDLQVSEARFKRLALVAAFSPAVSLLRACEAVYGEEATGSALPGIAALCLGSMRRYFNRPLVQQTIRQHRFRMRWRRMPAEDKGYAERALVYAGDAHLQAVFDEYVYLLRHAAQADIVEKALGQLGNVWRLSRGNPRTNRAKGQGVEVHIEENAEVHATHFALAFGEDISRDTGPDGDEAKMRKSVVREAFNSPFWPFVLATTSVGQEGLDFHLYCRDVLHWNLPSNPVDLEQREGRINRRDCLAIRESIARDSRLGWPAPSGSGERNPWLTVFDTIERSDDAQKYKHGLFPHWVYECHDPANTVRIQRHVPFFSTSRDAAKYERLKAGLALYRLVFGQANQEDLLDSLQQQTEGADPEVRNAKLKRLASYMLNLSPIGYEAARRYASDEADCLLRAGSDHAGLRELLRAVRELQTVRNEDLAEATVEVDGLVRMVERAMVSGYLRSTKIRHAVATLAYLRNPYDHIFDLQVEGGFIDDIEVIRKAWASIHKEAM